MDEKTEELRDIFMDVTDEATVTETQEEQRGSLAERENVRERLESVIARMRERYDFDTDLGDRELCRLVSAFYEDESDAEIARDLDVSRDTVVRARLDMHLFRDRDTDAPFDLDALRGRPDDTTAAEDAEVLGVSESTVRRYRRVLDARERSRAANERYRDEFETILGDGDLTVSTREAREDGLEEATEGLETNVSF